MITMNSLLNNYTFEITSSRRTERGDLIDGFLEKLNPSRIENGYKPLRFALLSKMFSERRMDKHQIYAFYKDCERAKNFSSYFWWALKPKA